LQRRRGPSLRHTDERSRRLLGLDVPLVQAPAPAGHSFLSADPDHTGLCAITRKVAGETPSIPHHGGVMLVAAPTTRVTQVARRCDDLRARGLTVTGVLVEHEVREEALT
jgi:hypothetical protein